MYIFYITCVCYIFYYMFKSNIKYCNDYKLIPFTKNYEHKIKQILKNEKQYLSNLIIPNKNFKNKKDYIKVCLNNNLYWNKDEIKMIDNFHKNFLERLKELGLSNCWIKNMPKNIYIIKNNTNHEDNKTSISNISAYSLSNIIFITEFDSDLITKKLFNIFLNFSPIIQKNLYKYYKFKIADDIKLPHEIFDLQCIYEKELYCDIEGAKENSKILEDQSKIWEASLFDIDRNYFTTYPNAPLVYKTITYKNNKKYIYTPLFYNGNMLLGEANIFICVNLRNRNNTKLLSVKYHTPSSDCAVPTHFINYVVQTNKFYLELIGDNNKFMYEKIKNDNLIKHPVQLLEIHFNQLIKGGEYCEKFRDLLETCLQK